MNSFPSIDQMLAGALLAIDDEILPALNNPKAYATAQMMQSLIQGVRQMLPVIEERLIEEHNDMIRTLHETAAALGESTGPATTTPRIIWYPQTGKIPMKIPEPTADAIRALVEVSSLRRARSLRRVVHPFSARSFRAPRTVFFGRVKIRVQSRVWTMLVRRKSRQGRK